MIALPQLGPLAHSPELGGIDSFMKRYVKRKDADRVYKEAQRIYTSPDEDPVHAQVLNP